MGKFMIREKNEKYSFRLKAGNGEVIATSQMYKSLQTCKAGIASVRLNAVAANLEDQTQEGFAVQKHPKFEVYQDNAGEYRFRLKAKNGQSIAASEGYKALKSCLNGIESVRKNAPDAAEEMEEKQE
ncbi:MAG: YegP family protein [Clostridia bacterium]|nr:YegP family protein [Clostridia bacterium]MDO5326074.1 YegP family protein [Clostridia bacterium]